MRSRLNLPDYLNQNGLIRSGVELGVLRGGFSQHILEVWKGEKLYCIDAWRTFQDHTDFNNVLIQKLQILNNQEVFL